MSQAVIGCFFMSIAVHQRIRNQIFLNNLQRRQPHGVFGANEAHQRHQQQCSIHGVTSLKLYECLPLLVPEVLIYRIEDDIPLDTPLRVEGKRTGLANLNGPVQSHPTHKARMKEFFSSTSDFPYSFVFLIPIMAHPVYLLGEILPKTVRNRFSILVENINGIQQFSINIQLQLRMGIVADSDWGGTSVTFHMHQHLFVHFLISRNGIHQFKAASFLHVLKNPFYPLHELFCFFDITQMHKRIYRERGVPDPGESIIPVSSPSYMLRKAESGSGHYRSVFMRNQQLQRQGRPVYDLPPSAVILGPSRPILPIIQRLL